MAILTPYLAKSHIKQAIIGQLKSVGGMHLSEVLQNAVPPLDFDKIANDIVEQLIENPSTREDLQFLVGMNQQLDGDQLISSADAAVMMGFSRPYVNAILDSSEFKGEVIRKQGDRAHRRVKVSAIQQWMKDHSVRSTHTEEDLALLNEPTDPIFFDEPELTSDERISRQVEILEGRAESIKNRPLHRLR